jgi:Isocitrate/isopropylmalate dehydrogenase
MIPLWGRIDDCIRELLAVSLEHRAEYLIFVWNFSCNIGEGGICLAEAVHGSAPDIAGKVSDPKLLECVELQIHYCFLRQIHNYLLH